MFEGRRRRASGDFAVSFGHQQSKYLTAGYVFFPSSFYQSTSLLLV